MKPEQTQKRKEEIKANLAAIGWDGDNLVRSWVGGVAPTLADQAATFVFGELYAMKQLPVRYRELLIAGIIATTGGLPDGAVQHLKVAIHEGVTPSEVDEMFTILAAYAGFPKAIAAAREYQRQQGVLTSPQNQS